MAAQTTQKNTVTFDPNLISVITNNPNLTVSASQFTAIAAGRITLVRGCVEYLRYGNNDDDLDLIRVGGQYFGEGQISNLKDFKERLREAALQCHKVSFCWDREERVMFMLNIIPCCKCCDDRQ